MAIPIPDFGGLAQQQGQTNAAAAQQQTQANRPTQTNPYGTLQWSQDANGNWTQNHTLSGGQQQIFDAATAGQGALAGTLGQGVGTAGLQGWGDAGSLTNGVSGMPQGGFGASQTVIDAMKALQQPGLDQARDAERARLAAMGITLGSDASNNSERQLSSAQNDANLKAILAGTQEYGNVFNRDMALRQQGVSENEKAFTMANTLRGLQGQERRDNNTSNIASLDALGRAKTGTTPGFAGFTGATALPPANMYQAGLDQYNAQLAQSNANSAQRANNISGGVELGSQILQGLGGVSGIASGLKDLWSWF